MKTPKFSPAAPFRTEKRRFSEIHLRSCVVGGGLGGRVGKVVRMFWGHVWEVFQGMSGF